MEKMKLGKDAFIIVIFTLITVLCWIGLEVYRSYTKADIPRVIQKQTAPLNPEVSVATLEELKARLSFTEEELNQVTATESGEKSVSPEPKPEATVEPSQSDINIIIDESTASGTNEE